MNPSESAQERESKRLSERQAAVLRAVVMAYVGEAAPIGSRRMNSPKR